MRAVRNIRFANQSKRKKKEKKEEEETHTHTNTNALSTSHPLPQVYEAFVFAFAPPPTIWGTAKKRAPRGDYPVHPTGPPGGSDPEEGQHVSKSFPPALPKKLPKRPARSKEGVFQYVYGRERNG